MFEILKVRLYQLTSTVNMKMAAVAVAVTTSASNVPFNLFDIAFLVTLGQSIRYETGFLLNVY